MPPVRRYPRVPFEVDGSMEFRLADHRVSVPITVRSFSCEGAGVKLIDQRHRLRPGTNVTMRFRADGDAFELPGRVAWCTRDSTRSGRFDLGVRFVLAATRHSMRQAYAKWVVGLIRDLRG